MAKAMDSHVMRLAVLQSKQQRARMQIDITSWKGQFSEKSLTRLQIKRTRLINLRLKGVRVVVENIFQINHAAFY